MSKYLSYIVLLLFFATLSPFQASGQEESPYKLSYKLDAPLLLGSAGLFATNNILDKKKDPLTLMEVDDLNASNIPAFDRGATRNFSAGLDNASDVLLFTSVALPFALASSREIRKDYLTIFVMAVEVGMLNRGLISLMKFSYPRVRPFAYNPEVPIGEKTTVFATESFFSGHTGSSSAFTFFAAKVISDYSDNDQLKKYIWIGAATIPAVTGYFRYEAGKHFPTDIITGYVVGASVGFLIPHLHKVKFNDDKVTIKPMTYYGASGFSIAIHLN